MFLSDELKVSFILSVHFSFYSFFFFNLIDPIFRGQGHEKRAFMAEALPQKREKRGRKKKQPSKGVILFSFLFFFFFFFFCYYAFQLNSRYASQQEPIKW